MRIEGHGGMVKIGDVAVPCESYTLTIKPWPEAAKPRWAIPVGQTTVMMTVRWEPGALEVLRATTILWSLARSGVTTDEAFEALGCRRWEGRLTAWHRRRPGWWFADLMRSSERN